MSALADRLRRLRGQAGATEHVPAPAAAVPATDAEPPALALQRLRRLLALRPARTGLPDASARPDLPLCGETLAEGVLAVERRYPVAASAPLLPPRWPDGEPVARERFLCFDTETTGLAGGSGTRAFMIGAADWCDDTLRVRQLYLTAMSGETAMLEAFASWLRPGTVLVSYNGRSYDAPLLRTRFRLQRLSDPLPGCAHIDLLHPVRRAYRGRWENCRLATIERHLLRIVRDDDLPGSEAPAAWRSFLRDGRTTALMRVLEHNRQDVVTLARLLEHLDEAAEPSRWMAGAAPG
ncbi:MAG TPA: ribonuclease H-like domain-containing protein [Tahibacter sp.]|uniref:ribonuclease H-like domain-containing protein n=1 Tax=Tahibacter sp. TaxID=2056211 RepID=UPI002BB75829|nr:ribonuclease H-like domain-containing protein [Tahibacter sp.]HSX59015.1 ribonuclease H-like domain-containing protein [Tahibacter sp.]